jgi:hypothetical protein
MITPFRNRNPDSINLINRSRDFSPVKVANDMGLKALLLFHHRRYAPNSLFREIDFLP